MRRSGTTGRRDPWDEVLSRHVSSHTSGPEPTRDGERKAGITRRGLAILLSSLAVVFVAALGALAWVAVENQDRGEAWQQRSRALTGLVEDRTRALNRQTARLNTASTRLHAARRAIARSEADVKDLERRQAELANEKAQVEDERAVLEAESQTLREQAEGLGSAAVLLADCNVGLREIMSLTLQGFVPSEISLSQTESTCSSAESGIADYLNRYGSP